MKNRLNNKIRELENYLSDLLEIIPLNFDIYSSDKKTKAACERYFERIIEAIVDLAFLVIRDKNLKTPEEDKEAFDILANEEIISKDLALKLKDAKGMRNIIAHEYGSIDNKIVFESITEELENDVINFIESIKQLKNKQKNQKITLI